MQKSKNGVPSAAGPLFRDAAAAWIASLQPRAKESTVNKYANTLEAYILPWLGDVRTDALGPEPVEALCRRLLLEGGVSGTGLSSKTVAGVLSVIRSVLCFSGSDAALRLANLRPPRKARRRELRVLSRSEQARLCAYLFAHPEPGSIGILLSLFAGLRVGEVCALRWEDVSFSEGTVHVCRTMQRIQDKSGGQTRTKVVVTDPKSPCSVRTIPLPEPLIPILAAYKSGEGYSLTNSDLRYMEPRTMQNCFKRTLKECGVADANYHALRHTFATRCVELGFDVKSLSEILGHSSVGITMDRYVHPSLDMKRDNMRLLDRLMV